MAERRRGAALEKALLDAAWEELTAQGYARFTMDAVVKRAGTSPSVLYRRWSDRDELARAAIAHRLRQMILPVPDTGSLREDVLTLLREINATRAQLSTTMYAHLAAHYQATGTRPGDLTDPTETGRKEAVDAIFDRAIERGEVDPRHLTERIRSLPFDLLRHELLTTFAPADDHTLEEIVDTIFLPLVAHRAA
ncbi:TetR/AcrR family transcriptional regulator [Actinomadura bangladeshensis]|uniref:TetR/AcrR family transcriptional regulator n=1 Tax=Actinomadura bangladeshensis TaxID=453573 RepID=A0A4R4NU97_9ACTN|nr:TetR/AcrR family transcriptional regulator [Actinomadura bangladeshensis]TDC13045.1 TetR/AcrR family transcriptional regulator [Actinomadura bangladeshensis]